MSSPGFWRGRGALGCAVMAASLWLGSRRRSSPVVMGGCLSSRGTRPTVRAGGHQFAPVLAPPVLGTGAPVWWRFRRSSGARPRVQELIGCSSLVVVADDLYVLISMGRQVPRNRGNLRGIPARGPVSPQVNR